MNMFSGLKCGASQPKQAMFASGPLSASLAYGGGSAIWISPAVGPKMILQGAQCLRADTVKPEQMHAEQLAVNARRMVACWNACQDVNTETLESNPELFTALRTERDELLEALKALAGIASPHLTTKRQYLHPSADGTATELVEETTTADELDAAIEAIAKATGAAS